MTSSHGTPKKTIWQRHSSSGREATLPSKLQTRRLLVALLLTLAPSFWRRECGGGFAPSATLGKGDHNDFGPRVGFAYDVFGDGKTSLRGGFGVSYESTLYNPLSNSRWDPPYYSFNSAQDAP